MNEAERELEAELSRIFDELTGATLPDAAVANIDSYGMCEDRKTLAVWVELEDGRTVFVSICPGAPISVNVVA